jgi:hypothetical protein
MSGHFSFVPAGQPRIAQRFERWDQERKSLSPGGTAEVQLWSGFQPSLRDLRLCPNVPGAQAPRYFQVVPTGTAKVS